MADMSDDSSLPDLEESSGSLSHSGQSALSSDDSLPGPVGSTPENVQWAVPVALSADSCSWGDHREMVTPDPATVTALYENCGRSSGGDVHVGRLLGHLGTHLPNICRGWLQSIAQLLAPDGEEEATVTADMFSAAVSAVNRTHAELHQPGSVPGSTPPSRSPPAGGGGALGAGRFSVGSRASSLGILHSSQLLDASGCSSYEGVGQQLSPVDVPALEGTIAQLQHSGRALQEERDQLQLQLQQLEETNQQLAAELAQLTERNGSMSVELQRIPSLRQEAERLQSVLETECRQRTEQQDQTAHLERLIAAQQEEMELLSTKLSAAELEVSRAAGRERSLHTALEEVRREADHLRQDLSDRDGRNAAAQATIGALHITIREMHDTSLALQEEKSRTSHELSSVKKQLHTLRRSTPAAAETPRSGSASLQNNGSIHDEILSTIQTTGDGDSELPLSGIASPELVQAIYASPPNLHFKKLPRRLQLSSTPQSHQSQQQEQEQDQERSPLDNPDESAELDERYSSAASDSYGSPEIWRSRPPSVVEMAVQTEPGSGSERRAADGATQTEQEPDREDGAVPTGPQGQPPGGTAARDRGTETGTVPGQTTETESAAGGRQLSESESGSRCVLTEEAATQTEYDPAGMSAGQEEDADFVRLWNVPGTSLRPCSDNTCAATYGADKVGGEGAALSAAERRWLRTALQQTDGLQRPLLHQLTDLFFQQEMLAGGSYSAAGPGVGMKRTHSDGALSAPLRTRFCSMPTVEEVPDDPDTDIPQHSPLRASFSLPCDPTEVGIFPSLTEHMLADLHYHADENANNTNEKDLESKFSSLALAFKTDRLTLHERLDVQRRHRDQAEQNLDLEAQRFREQLMMLTQSDADRSEQMKSLQRQLDIIKQISQRLSRTAEVLGAAQQELRVSRAVEVMTQHVESLRHLYEREHAELEEARRVLATNNIALHEPVQKAAPGGRRRASIAVFAPRPAGQPLGGLSGGPLTGHPVQTLSPSPSSPTLGATGLRRRRNSLGAGDTDGFGAIKEEKEDERTEPDQTHPSSEQQLQPTAALPSSSAPSGEQQLQQQDHQHLQQQDQPADVEDLRTHVEETVSDELATLRSEQEQLANDLKTLLSRQRDAVLQQTTTVGKLLWDVAQAWPYSREQTVARARYCVGGLFLLLAIMVLLVPPAYTSCNTQPHAFYSWAELLSPHLSLRHVHRPPL